MKFEEEASLVGRYLGCSVAARFDAAASDSDAEPPLPPPLPPAPPELPRSPSSNLDLWLVRRGLGKYLDAVAALGPAVEVVGGAADLGEGDVVWLESPRNPDLRVPDVAGACAGPADVVVDATFAPLAQRLLDDDVACVVHSATKGLGGHSDLLGGVAITRCADLADRLAWHRTAAGAAPGSLDCWLLLRSLRTLDVRVTRQSSSAQRVAEALEASGLLQRVLYPGLASHPDHAVAKRQMTSYGSILAVECRSEAAARALPEALTLFRSATSLGGVESLAEWRRKYDDAVSPLLVRLSIGLEDPDDLIEDLLSALRRLE